MQKGPNFFENLSYPQVFAKNRFAKVFGSHVEFLGKLQKCIYLRNSACEIAILKFSTHRVYTVICQFLPKIIFQPILVAILSLCVKLKSCIVYAKSSTTFLPKTVFTPFYMVILEFCVKCKNVFISK